MTRFNTNLLCLVSVLLLGSCKDTNSTNNNLDASSDVGNDVYASILNELKNTSHPTIAGDYRLLSSDLYSEASAGLYSSSSTSYQTTSSNSGYSGSTYRSNYSDNAPVGLGYTSKADKDGVGAVFAWKKSIDSGNYAQAGRDSQAVLDNARLTGDPEAIRDAQIIRDKTREIFGY